MHEYSIVSALIDRVAAEAAARKARAVNYVKVSIGEIAGVEIGLLQTAYEIARIDTVCAMASLEVRSVPVQWVCPHCDMEPARGRPLVCPRCGEPVRLVAGDEIMLDQIELEVS